MIFSGFFLIKKAKPNEKRFNAVERNVHFETAGLSDIVVHLAWAQLEIFADDVEKIQVLVAGDENSVSDLRIETKDGILLVEQPQYGLSLNVMGSKWMQVCIRVPRAWPHQIHATTLSGLLSARGLSGSRITLETVSGDMRGLRLTAQELLFKTISGDVRAEALTAPEISLRSVSGDLVVDEAKVQTLRCNSVSGEQTYNLSDAFKRMDINTVSGNVIITSPLEKLNMALRSISGRVRTEGVAITDDSTAPSVKVTGVSADVKLICVKA